MRIVVTGATGFVGTAFVRRMVKAGARVDAITRATSHTDTLDALGVRCVALPLEADHADSLAELCSGADAVVHLAGGGRVARHADFAKNNGETTATLVSAANRADQPPPRFVLLSSMAARGPAPSSDRAASDVPDAPITAYGSAKLEAERCLESLRPEVSPLVLRPPGIYGPGDDRMLPLYRAAQRGWIPLPAAGRSASFVYIDDCVDGIERALDCAPAPGPMYVEDGQPRSTRDVAKLIAERVGPDARILPVPTWILRTGAMLTELVSKARSRPVAFTRDKARDLVQPHWVCDSRPFREHAGWRSQVDMSEGIGRTVHDYRARGWL